MKKIMLMSTTIILTTLLCVVPFSVRTVKAAGNLVYATGGTFTEGEYNVYTAQASSGSYLQFYAFDKYYSFDQYHSACIVKIDLNDIYSGDITLNFSSNYTMFPLWWVETEQGSCGIDGINKQIILHLTDVQSLTVYLCSTNTSSNGIQPTSVDSSLTKTSDSIADLLADYQIELQSLPAWIFASATYDSIVYDNGMKYPYVSVKAGDVTKYQNFSPGKTYIFYCMLSAGASTSTISMTNGSVSVEIYSLPYYRFNGGYRIWRFTYQVITTTDQVSAMRWGIDNNVIPLYFGDGRNMTVEMQSLLGTDSPNLTTDKLDQLIALLAAQGDPDTSQDIDNTSDDLSDISGQINVITDQIDIDFNNNINNIDLDDHDFFTGLTNTTNYFKVYVQDFYNNIGDIKALLIVPVIVTIMMLIAGWMF